MENTQTLSCAEIGLSAPTLLQARSLKQKRTKRPFLPANSSLHMTTNQDRGAFEDLETMLDRSLKIQATSPRWQPSYRSPNARGHSKAVQQTSDASFHPQGPITQDPGYISPTQGHYASSYAQNGASRGIPHDSATNGAHNGANNVGSTARGYPPCIPLVGRLAGSSPQAVSRMPYGRPETQATPPKGAALGMRENASLHSTSSLSSPEALDRRHSPARVDQRQYQALMHQQAEQLKFKNQRQEKLLELQEQQQMQEQELEMLRQREIQQFSAQRQEEDLQRQEMYARELQMEEFRARELQRQDYAQQELHARELQDREVREYQARELQAREIEARIQREMQFSEMQAREQREVHIRELQVREQKELDARDAQARDAQARDAQDKEIQARDAQARKLQARDAQAREAREAQREDGAATMVQRTQDSQGNVTMRVVKKGVEDFDFKDELGTGSYSTVVAAQDKQTLRHYAIKVLDKGHIIKEQKVKYVEIEKHTLNRLGDHPGIIRLYFTFQDRQSLYFVLDFAPNGELLQLIKRIGSLSEECARYYASQLLDAIEYMHNNGVIHRDLKPENILLDYKMRIKITDFGTAKLLKADPATGKYPPDARANSFVGTAEYVSPELLVGKSQGKSADLWAWGCVLYQMIAAMPPFQGNTPYLTFQKVMKLQYSLPPGFPFMVRDLLKHVLVKPQQRWSIDEIKQHEFFEGQEWSSRALWSSSPPQLQPYKASVASMKPRALASSHPTKPSKPAYVGRPQPAKRATQPHQTQPQQQFVPTAAGLQALNPATLYGMPLNLSKFDTSALLAQPTKSSAGSSRSTKKASSASLYKNPPQTSSSYQQSQERIQALKKRMQEQRLSHQVGSNSYGCSSSALRPSTSGPSSSSDSGSDSPLNDVPVRSASASSFNDPSVVHLAQPPLTQLESQYSSILSSAQERILRVGYMNILVSTHLPPQAQASSSKPSSSGKGTKDQSSTNCVGRKSSGHADVNDGEVDTAFSYDDDTLFSKLFLSKNKPRLVIITTYGRLLIMADERKILYEVPLGVPQISVSEVMFRIGDGRAPRLVVQTHNRVLTLDDPGRIPRWLESIELSKQYYSQLVADQERSSFNAAAAAASAVAGRRR